MSDKIHITIDMGKVTKDKITSRTYKNEAGEEVVAKEYKLEVVPLKALNRKVLKSGDGWEMVKTHFVCEAPNEEEKKEKLKTKIVGNGITFISAPQDGVDDDWDDDN